MKRMAFCMMGILALGVGGSAWAGFLELFEGQKKIPSSQKLLMPMNTGKLGLGMREANPVDSASAQENDEWKNIGYTRHGKAIVFCNRSSIIEFTSWKDSVLQSMNNSAGEYIFSINLKNCGLSLLTEDEGEFSRKNFYQFDNEVNTTGGTGDGLTMQIIVSAPGVVKKLKEMQAFDSIRSFMVSESPKRQLTIRVDIPKEIGAQQLIQETNDGFITFPLQYSPQLGDYTYIWNNFTKWPEIDLVDFSDRSGPFGI